MRLVRRIAVTLGASLALLLGVVLATFFLFRVLPGEPARAMLGPMASQDAVELLRNQYGLDRPISTQLVDYLAGVLRLDFGSSLSDRREVLPLVIERFSQSAMFALPAILVASLLAYGANMLAEGCGRKSLFLNWATVPLTLPPFAITLVVTLAALVVAPGLTTPGALWSGSLLLATVSLAVYPTALLGVTLRKLSDSPDGHTFALARESLPPTSFAFHRFSFRPVAASWLIAVDNILASVFVSAFVVEQIFGITGTGALLVMAIQNRDFPVLGGLLIVNAAFFISIRLSIRGLRYALDPRSLFE